MPDLARPEALREEGRECYHGFVVTPPEALAGPFTVALPDFDSARVFEVRYWTARGLTLPAEGDLVLIAIDDRLEPWCVSWWPAEGDAGLAPEPPQNFGLVTALPSGAAGGDECYFQTGGTEVWHLVYDGNGIFPWAKIGGAPLRKQYNGALSTKSATAQTTNAPSITSPLAMEAKATYGCAFAGLTAEEGLQQFFTPLFVDGTETDKTEGVGISVVGIVGRQIYDGGTIHRVSVPFTVAKGKAVQTRYRTQGSATAGFNDLFVELDPLRVG